MDPNTPDTSRPLEREVSAGGVVMGPAGVLLIKVKNKQGHVVWTFPKGHLEKGETAETAALREVLEETGWRCRILGPLMDVEYPFTRKGKVVMKTVHWFRMEALDRTGEWDPEEVIDCRWSSLFEAKSLVTYGSDIKILERIGKGVHA
ncbi:MAG: NUDIX hydrolase [Elusimicrobia bacterium]|jgi:ADP-ribose pyrophosphatase YjhB (NUDIX family)|nr:NUDIX hydrolase [Elusimicrobiota bacterium]